MIILPVETLSRIHGDIAAIIASLYHLKMLMS